MHYLIYNSVALLQGFSASNINKKIIPMKFRESLPLSLHMYPKPQTMQTPVKPNISLISKVATI